MTATCLYVLILYSIYVIKKQFRNRTFKTLFHNNSKFSKMTVHFTKTKLLLMVLCALTIMAFTFKEAPQKAVHVAPPISPSTTQEVIDAANAFKATLSAAQITTAYLDYSFANAVKWSNLPQALSRNRVGIAFSTLSATQLAAAKLLIKAASGSTGTEGYAEIEGLLAADDYLGVNGGGTDYGSGNYYLALLGTPALMGTWELQFGGHHLAFANTYKNGNLVGATPSFRAVEPFASFTSGGSTYQPILQERDAFAAIYTSLTAAQRTSATLSGSFGDLVLTPGKDWQFPTTKSGLVCSGLDATQKALVLAAIKTYVDDIDTQNAATIMTKYTNELNQTYVGFAGTGTMATQGDYVRIDGPSVWIEYSTQGGIIIRNTPHPHSVWRDRTGDYGGTGNPTGVKSVDATVYKMANYPNPTSGLVTLKFTLPQEMTIKIAIYDMTGRMVKAVSKGKMPSGDNNLIVDVSNLAAGVYSYTLENENGERATNRLVKN